MWVGVIPLFCVLGPFDLALATMTHPLIAPVLELAEPIAAQLGLELVGAVFHTHQSPPILRVDIRRPAADTSLEDCEQMSEALEAVLDVTDLFPEAYVLEISSPGLSDVLTTDQDFQAFQGFEVVVQLREPHRGRQTWQGKLAQRDAETLYLNLKGRPIALPRPLVEQVTLTAGRPD